MIVIDVGCATYQGARSMSALIERFKPRILYGFDPKADELHLTDDRVARALVAAWTYDGMIGFREAHTGSYITDNDNEPPQVPCIDLARFIRGLPLDEAIILKLDCEGAEYGLLTHLAAEGLDERLALCLVEWHRDERVELRCPVEAWE